MVTALNLNFPRHTPDPPPAACALAWYFINQTDLIYIF